MTLTILAVCLASAALLAAVPAIVLGVIGYRRLDRELLDLEDRVDQIASRQGMPSQPRPSTPTSLFDRRPEEI